MSKKDKEPKTTGVVWLINSLGSFNGSGYADMQSPVTFLESYRAYKTVKNQPQAVAASIAYQDEALEFLEQLLVKTAGAGRTPAPKHLAKVRLVQNQERLI